MFLAGRKKQLIKKLSKKYPEQAEMLKHIQDVALIQNEEIKNPLYNNIHRIESYDVSHLSGKEVYGSMAVFENGQKNTDEYRIFKIKKDKNNDLENLAEIIRRRFNHPEWKFPDLVVIDGGRPQVNYLEPILSRLNLNIVLLGISKYGGDKIIYSKDIKSESKKLIESNVKILKQARDEAHRFANRFRLNKQRSKFRK